MTNLTSIEAYKNMLEHSYEMTKQMLECPPHSRVAFLADHVFDFTTYDDDASELFGKKALEVCVCISDKKTFEYQHSGEESYRWYLLMCNMPFFQGKLEWGTSIRGAWWEYGKTFEIGAYTFFKDSEQISEVMKFNNEQWLQFVEAMKEFANV